jgi:hypothetical protein
MKISIKINNIYSQVKEQQETFFIPNREQQQQQNRQNSFKELNVFILIRT